MNWKTPLRHVFSVISVVLVGTAPVQAADYLAMSGEQLYMRFCASCHGIEGHGDGRSRNLFQKRFQISL